MVAAAAATEPMNGERNIDAVHAKATVRAQSTESRFIGRPYRWSSMSALQDRYVFVLIYDASNQSSRARRLTLIMRIGKSLTPPQQGNLIRSLASLGATSFKTYSKLREMSFCIGATVQLRLRFKVSFRIQHLERYVEYSCQSISQQLLVRRGQPLRFGQQMITDCE